MGHRLPSERYSDSPITEHQHTSDGSDSVTNREVRLTLQPAFSGRPGTRVESARLCSFRLVSWAPVSMLLAETCRFTEPHGPADRPCRRERYIFPDFSDRCDRTLARERLASYRFNESSRERCNCVESPARQRFALEEFPGHPTK